MGYSDQKYYSRPMEIMGQSGVLTGTLTASSTANAIAAAAYRIPKFIKRTKVNGGKFVVKTAATTGLQVISLLNGTNTFATTTNTSTNAAGIEITLTLTNTASTAVSTQTTTLPNGSTVVGTITTTTDWSIFGTGTGITVAVAGTATASGDSFGAFDMWLEVQEKPDVS